jgi:RND family efflux transporter MFP subunit
MSKRRWIYLGVALAVIAIGALAYRQWALSRQADTAAVQTATVERGTVTSSVDAAGTIEVTRSASLTWQTSGTVGSVNVELGDVVREGDVLMELAPDSLGSSVIQAQADLLAAQQDLDELLAGPTAQVLAQAQLRVANAREALRVADYTWTVRQQGNRGSLDTIAGARANLVIEQSNVDRAEDEYGGVSGLSDDDPDRATALVRLVAARRQRDSALRSLNWYLGPPTEIQHAVLDAVVATAEAELEDAQQALETLQNGPDPVAVAAARARVANPRAIVDEARQVAPFDGTVVAISSGVGDQVSSNTAALTLADLSQYQVEVAVSELDVEQIAVDQEVTLTLDALPDQMFVGRVADVAFMGSSNQGVITYPVTVVLDDPDPALRPGMTTAVSIVVERHEGVVIVPNRAIQVSGGQRVVRVLYQGQEISVPVTLGLVGDTASEIAEGALQEGDEVVLNTSSSSQTSSFVGGPGIMGLAGGEMRR